MRALSGSPSLKSFRGSRGMPRMRRIAWKDTVVKKNLEKQQERHLTCE